MTINTLPDNVFVEIFSLCRTDEVDDAIWALSSYTSWKWCRLAHVCRTWRHIMFASSRHLHLDLRCTGRTPVKKNLSYLPAFPLVVSFLSFNSSRRDRDNLISALENPDRVRVVELYVPYSLFEELAMVMQEPFPALAHLRLEAQNRVSIPALPDTFLAGSAPRLQTIYLAGFPFPAAPTLLLSAHDLVDVVLQDIPSTGYIPPEVLVASLAALPRLDDLTFGFEWGMSYPDRIRLPVPPVTRTVLPTLTRFYFEGLLEYFEDLVAQIDAPQLDCLQIEYRDQQDFQIPQLCKFINRPEKLSSFRRALLRVDFDAVTIHLFHRDQSSFRLSIQGGDAIGQVVNQISAMLSNVDHLSIESEYCLGAERGDGIRWLEFLRPFTAVKALFVEKPLSRHIPLALKNVTGERAAEVLPALELLCLEDELVASLEVFLTVRPVTVINEERQFQHWQRVNSHDAMPVHRCRTRTSTRCLDSYLYTLAQGSVPTNLS
jgi:hypothetical protein